MASLAYVFWEGLYKPLDIMSNQSPAPRAKALGEGDWPLSQEDLGVF